MIDVRTGAFELLLAVLVGRSVPETDVEEDWPDKKYIECPAGNGVTRLGVSGSPINREEIEDC